MAQEESTALTQPFILGESLWNWGSSLHNFVTFTLQATILEVLQYSGEFLILADKIIYLKELITISD